MSSFDSAQPQATLEAKVDFLERVDAYPESPGRVERVGTHFAYVFLTDRFAYKLKKPIRFHAIDFTTLEARRTSCESELALNRRLAESTYLAVVPLAIRGTKLTLEAPDGGTIVDWLVKMQRLPRDGMLDARAVADNVSDSELRTLLGKLAAFYTRARRTDWDGPAYRRHLEDQLRAARADLAARASKLHDDSWARLASELLAFLADAAADIEARCADSRIVDAHGDLRPEHIFLADDPQVIDCLEFSAELRMLDTAEEIAFLTLECTELGNPALAARIVALYRSLCRDPLPSYLFDYYYAQRALSRARSCAWHLDEPLADDVRAHWIRRTQRYLEAALTAVQRARRER